MGVVVYRSPCDVMTTNILNSIVLFCIQVFTVYMPISNSGGGGSITGSGGDVSGYVGFILMIL